MGHITESGLVTVEVADKIYSTAKVPLSKAENTLTARHLCVNCAMELGEVILLVAYMIQANTFLTDNYLFSFFFFSQKKYFFFLQRVNSRSTLAHGPAYLSHVKALVNYVCEMHSHKILFSSSLCGTGALLLCDCSISPHRIG